MCATPVMLTIFRIVGPGTECLFRVYQEQAPVSTSFVVCYSSAGRSRFSVDTGSRVAAFYRPEGVSHWRHKTWSRV
jgi:hypothetical protein